MKYGTLLTRRKFESGQTIALPASGTSIVSKHKFLYEKRLIIKNVVGSYLTLEERVSILPNTEIKS